MTPIKNIIVFLFFALLLNLFVTSCSKSGSGKSVTVEGRLENMSQSYFLLSVETGGDSIVFDTIKVDENGRFSFTKDIDTLSIATLFLNQEKTSVNIFVNKGWKVQIEGNINAPDLIKVTGGDVNDDIATFKEECKTLLETKARIENSLRDTLSTNGVVQLSELKNINYALSNKAKDYIQRNPSKIASVVLIDVFFKTTTTIDILDKLLASLQGDALSYQLTGELKDYSGYVKKSMIGAIAPNFSLNDISGKNVNMTSFRTKFIVLSFFSVTCEFCEADIPRMKEVYDLLASNQPEIVFVQVYTDSEIDQVKRETASFPKKWIVLNDTREWAAESIDLYNVTQIPYHILISPDGKILDRGFSITSLPEIIQK